MKSNKLTTDRMIDINIIDKLSPEHSTPKINS